MIPQYLEHTLRSPFLNPATEESFDLGNCCLLSTSPRETRARSQLPRPYLLTRRRVSAIAFHQSISFTDLHGSAPFNNGGTEHGSLELSSDRKLCLVFHADDILAFRFWSASSLTIGGKSPSGGDRLTALPLFSSGCPVHASTNLMTWPQSQSLNYSLKCPNAKCTYEHLYTQTWFSLWTICD